MDRANQALLFLHFIGLALGFSVSFGNIVMGRLIEQAPPPEKAILGRFPPAPSRLGPFGLALLWITGIILVYTRWDGFSGMPGMFHAKLTAVVLLTLTSGRIHTLEARAAKGDPTAIPAIQKLGKVATSLALAAVLFAVLTFD